MSRSSFIRIICLPAIACGLILSSCNHQPTDQGVKFDNEPPETAFSPTPPDGSMNNDFKLRVEWHANDADGIIKGYEYRVEGPLFDNTWTFTESFFVDFKFRDGWYTLEVRGVDNAGSIDPTPARLRLHVLGPTFDKGILLMDDEALGGENEIAADAIYDSLMQAAGYPQYTVWDYQQLFATSRPIFAAAESDTDATGQRKAGLGSFSTIIWYTQATGNLGLNQNTLRDYLDMGGNLLIAGVNPLASLTGESPNGAEYPSSGLAYKYFRILRARTVDVNIDQLISDNPILPDIHSTLKLRPTLTLYFKAQTNQLVHSYDAEPIYAYSTNYYRDPNRNLEVNSEEFAGLSCAQFHRGNGFNTAIFGFPLVVTTRSAPAVYVNLLDTKAVAQAVRFVLHDVFQQQ
jgi:hypothetical protein